MAGYEKEDLTAEEIAHQRSVFGPLTQSVRDLVDAVVRTEVDEDDLRVAQAEIEAVTKRLRERQTEGGFGVRFNESGRSRAWGNAVVGLRNAVAPPLVVEHDPRGHAWAEFHLGAAYEGPPTLVHGGVSAMILDQMLGEAVGAAGKPGMTGTLTLRYHRPTRLGDLRAEARIERVEGVKTFAVGHIADAEGVTVEAEGVFILPRWARKALADGATPPRFD